jgi:predicted HAD superfamily Cof-like phosphohydrolase
MQHQVLEFHQKFGVAIENHPTLPGQNLAVFRSDLIQEESEEFHDAVLVDYNIIEAIDALCDILYVTFGAANSLGVDLESHFDAVHAANMRKIGGPTREDGKILKPEGWIGPNENHQRILDKHESDLTYSA